jgi:hypothetical protein
MNIGEEGITASHKVASVFIAGYMFRFFEKPMSEIKSVHENFFGFSKRHNM